MNQIFKTKILCLSYKIQFLLSKNEEFSFFLYFESFITEELSEFEV